MIDSSMMISIALPDIYGINIDQDYDRTWCQERPIDSLTGE